MMRVDEPTWRSAMSRVFAALVPEHPDFGTERLLDSFEAVTRELAATRRQSQREVPLAYRYELTFRRLGWSERDIRTLADRAVQVHRAAIATHCRVSPEASRIVHYCRSLGMRVGVVSNFDDAASVNAVLEKDHLHQQLDIVVVSADVGWRKPHPAIFQRALAGLGVMPKESLFVGDSFEEDVRGPRSIGMDAAWLVPGEPPEEQRLEATFCLSQLSDLLPVLR